MRSKQLFPTATDAGALRRLSFQRIPQGRGRGRPLDGLWSAVHYDRTASSWEYFTATAIKPKSIDSIHRELEATELWTPPSSLPAALVIVRDQVGAQ